MTLRRARTCAAVALGAALLAGAAVPTAAASDSVASAPHTRAVTPQDNIPTLDAPGPAQTVNYSPDGGTRNHFSRIDVVAPTHTRITGLNPNCQGMSCPVTIAPDGKSAFANMLANRWIWLNPLQVTLVADDDAPLSGGTYSGTFSLDGDTQPLTVNISPGTQGAISAFLQTAPGGGGVNVAFVLPGSNAAQSGLQAGDVITAVNGVDTPTLADLNNAIIGRRAGARVPVTIIRGGQAMTVQLQLDQPNI